ncbi:MAG: holo-ACP synthase [Candidatus Neomarinimicrobiota bacterium]|nr:holo-ACP synthase [Candidatus Neomarinimicrobiota bacterium]MED5265726.1 holo-ACP synthase [Candidatus Neomarinimicrobiota bacterium]
MSEYFIGTDIVSVSRIEKILQQYSDRFKKHVFTDKEKSYCDLKSNPAVHYAGRFAAKEAVKKALYSSSIINSIDFADIEIISNVSGAPEVKLSTQDLKNVLVKVSISHIDELAIAFALVSLS